MYDTMKPVLSQLNGRLSSLAHILGIKQPAVRMAQSARRHVGSSRRLTDIEQTQILGMLRADIPILMICAIYHVSRPTIYNLRDKHAPELNRRNGHPVS